MSLFLRNSVKRRVATHRECSSSSSSIAQSVTWCSDAQGLGGANILGWVVKESVLE